VFTLVTRISFPLIVCYALIAQSNGGTYSLSGIVVNSVTGEPVRNALVTVSKAPTPEEAGELHELGRWVPILRKTALSGFNGDYQITGLPEGHYTVRAQKPGFASGFGPEQAQPVQVDVSAAVSNITVKLPPLGAIEGTVVDQNREPVDSVRIEAYTARIEDGERVIASNHSAVCDDRGKFRIWDLEPGQYYLKATGRNGGTYLFLGQGTPRPSSWLSSFPYTRAAGLLSMARRRSRLPPARKRGRISGSI
jgi:hypothetical protein